MAAKKKSSVQNVLVWTLMGLLILGLAGFGVDGLLSQRVTAIGSVGAREIDARTYSRVLQNEVRALEQQFGQPLPMDQVQALGIDQRVRARLVTQAALEAEADRIGISVGDLAVSSQIATIDAFRGPGGAFDRDTYRFALENAGLTPAEFEDGVRREAARGILQAATSAGASVPEPLRQAVLAHFASRRDVAVVVLGESALAAPLAAPDAAAIQAYYEANIAQFTAPEVRRITFAWLSPDALIPTIAVDPAAIQALYDSRAAEFQRPERRLVERLIFPDQAAAQAAMARLAEGATFEDMVADRGLALADTDMGDVTRADLGAAADPVFALTDPGSVTGPHQTNLGPAVFRMNAILSAQITPLEAVRDELHSELAADAARRQVAERFDAIEDLLAGGATLEDLAAEAGMTLGSLDWHPGVDAGIAAYDEFRTAAAAAAEGDFPEALTMSDGGIFALRLDGIIPAAPRPLAEVQAEAAAGARAQALSAALTARAQELAPALAAQDLEAFAEATGLVAEEYAALTRLDRITALPAALVEAIHGSAAGATVVVAEGGEAFLAKITALAPPDPGDAETERLVEAIDAELGAALQGDIFAYFARALEAEAGISLNQAAIDAVHAGFR